MIDLIAYRYIIGAPLQRPEKFITIISTRAAVDSPCGNQQINITSIEQGEYYEMDCARAEKVPKGSATAAEKVASEETLSARWLEFTSWSDNWLQIIGVRSAISTEIARQSSRNNRQHW